MTHQLYRSTASHVADAEFYIRNQTDKAGFIKHFINDSIGYGIFAARDIQHNEFLLEYRGVYLDPVDADKFEDQTFLYYFDHGRKHHCVDATESICLAKFVNDSPTKFANCRPKVVVVDGKPHIALFALNDIPVGMELRFNYGGNLPWRKLENASLKPMFVDAIMSFTGDIMTCGDAYSGGVNNTSLLQVVRDEICGKMGQSVTTDCDIGTCDNGNSSCVTNINLLELVHDDTGNGLCRPVTQNCDIETWENDNIEGLVNTCMSKLTGCAIGNDMGKSDTSNCDIETHDTGSIDGTVNTDVSKLTGCDIGDDMCKSASSDCDVETCRSGSIDGTVNTGISKLADNDNNGDGYVTVCPSTMAVHDFTTNGTDSNHDALITNLSAMVAVRIDGIGNLNMGPSATEDDNIDTCGNDDTIITNLSLLIDGESYIVIDEDFYINDDVNTGTATACSNVDTVNANLTNGMADNYNVSDSDVNTDPSTSPPADFTGTSSDVGYFANDLSADLKSVVEDVNAALLTMDGLDGNESCVSDSCVSDTESDVSSCIPFVSYPKSLCNWKQKKHVMLASENEGCHAANSVTQLPLQPSQISNHDMKSHTPHSDSDIVTQLVRNRAISQFSHTGVTSPNWIPVLTHSRTQPSRIPVPLNKSKFARITQHDSGHVTQSSHLAQPAQEGSNSVTHSEPVQKSTLQKNSKTPMRPCLYCGKMVVRLTRHLRRMHKDEKAIVDAVKCGSKKQRQMFQLQKRIGINKYNLDNIGRSDFRFLRERATKGPISENAVVCDRCYGVFSRQWFRLHREKCIGDSCFQPSSVPTAVYYSPTDVSEQFKVNVLSKFARDDIGKFCVKDPIMRFIGSRLYAKISSRPEKKLEVRRSIMADMRRLATLFLNFKAACQEAVAKDCQRTVGTDNNTVCLTDMFLRTNFDLLEAACVNQTTGEGEKDKSALMMSLYYLIIKCAKIIRVRFLVQNKTLEANQTMEFLEVLREEKYTLIGSAIYAVNKNRNTKLRRPEELPKDEHLATLRKYSIERMQSLLNDEFTLSTSTEFVEMRDLVCCRLTLFNGRRGGEPARLKLNHWEDAVNRRWFDASRIAQMTPEEQDAFKDSYLMYQDGKGVDWLVPVIVPEDIVPAMHKIADPFFRSSCGINLDNDYLFPCTQDSKDHISGWHAVHSVCLKAGVPTITATKMRHLTSTLYAALDIPEEKRSAFYRHMGHGKSVNMNIYQAPLAEVEVRHVGTLLRKFDESRQMTDKSLSSSSSAAADSTDTGDCRDLIKTPSVTCELDCQTTASSKQHQQLRQRRDTTAVCRIPHKRLSVISDDSEESLSSDDSAESLEQCDVRATSPWQQQQCNAVISMDVPCRRLRPMTHKTDASPSPEQFDVGKTCHQQQRLSAVTSVLTCNGRNGRFTTNDVNGSSAHCNTRAVISRPCSVGRRKRDDDDDCGFTEKNYDEEIDTSNMENAQLVSSKRRPRQHKTHWSLENSKLISSYFAGWISQKQDFSSLPGKSNITAFLNKYPSIQLEWTIVRNKVLSEKNAYAKRKLSRLAALR